MVYLRAQRPCLPEHTEVVSKSVSWLPVSRVLLATATELVRKTMPSLLELLVG